MPRKWAPPPPADRAKRRVSGSRWSPDCRIRKSEICLPFGPPNQRRAGTSLEADLKRALERKLNKRGARSALVWPLKRRQLGERPELTISNIAPTAPTAPARFDSFSPPARLAQMACLPPARARRNQNSAPDCFSLDASELSAGPTRAAKQSCGSRVDFVGPVGPAARSADGANQVGPSRLRAQRKRARQVLVTSGPHYFRPRPRRRAPATAPPQTAFVADGSDATPAAHSSLPKSVKCLGLIISAARLDARRLAVPLSVRSSQSGAALVLRARSVRVTQPVMFSPRKQWREPLGGAIGP